MADGADGEAAVPRAARVGVGARRRTMGAIGEEVGRRGATKESAAEIQSLREANRHLTELVAELEREKGDALAGRPQPEALVSLREQLERALADAAGAKEELAEARRGLAAKEEALRALQRELDGLRERERRRELLAVAEAEAFPPPSRASTPKRDIATASTCAPESMTFTLSPVSTASLVHSRSSPKVEIFPGCWEGATNKARRERLSTLRGSLRGLDEDINMLWAKANIRTRA